MPDDIALRVIRRDPILFGPARADDDYSNGFVERADSTLTWDDETRTLSVQPTADYFEYYLAGRSRRSYGDTHQIADVEGTHYVYYDEEGITSIANPQEYDVDQLIREDCLISAIYWDADSQTGIYIGEERHGRIMSPDTHAYLHFIEGMRYLQGLALLGFNTDGTGGQDADAQFGSDPGIVVDEDLPTYPPAVGSTVGLPIYYLSGPNAHLRRAENPGFSVLTTGTGRLAWNEFVGGAWQLTEAINGDFVNCHVFATGEINRPLIAVVGQAEYANLREAREGAKTEIFEITTNEVLFPEIRAIGSVIFETRDVYANAVKARVRTTDEGDDYVDWRSETISRVALSTNDHGSLAGLLDDDHTQYLPLSGVRAMTGALDLGSNDINNVNSVRFDLAPNNGAEEGRLIWNPEAGTLNIGQKGGNVNLQIGQEFLARVKNESGGDILNGQAVYVTGSVGNFATVDLASNAAFGSSLAIGIATEDILNGGFGFVTLAGKVNEVDTSGLIVGAPLWVGSTPGSYTQIRPAAPTPTTLLGYPVRISATEGIIEVRIEVINNLADLPDVNIRGATIADKSILQYDSANGYWDQVDLATAQNHLNITTVNVSTYTVADSDRLLHVTRSATGACAIELPSVGAVAGRVLTVKDASGNAGTNAITISTEGAETIDGASTQTLNADYQYMSLYSDGSNWYVV